MKPSKGRPRKPRHALRKMRGVYMTDEQYERVRRQAERLGMTFSQYAERIIKEGTNNG